MLSETTKRTTANAAWMLVSGISIGWLSGLSVSPVLATVLSSLLAALGGVVAGLHSVEKDRERGKLTHTAPVALLLLGVAIAAPVGVMVRTHCLLEVGRECAPQTSVSKGVEPRSNARVGGLFSSPEANQDWCEESLRAPDQTIANTMKRAGDRSPWIVEIANTVDSPEDLRRIVEAICASY